MKKYNENSQRETTSVTDHRNDVGVQIPHLLTTPRPLIIVYRPIFKILVKLRFFRKRAKKAQNIWKFGQKCTKFENILKRGRWLRAIIARNKLLE